MKITIKGTVQGVGFRPHVFLLAKKYTIKGFVRNKGCSVEIFINKNFVNKNTLKKFLKELSSLAPPLAKITSIEIDNQSTIQQNNFEDFKIQSSVEGNDFKVPFDSCICNECFLEIKQETKLKSKQKNNRFNYFMTACTECGPRFSISKKIPFDRINNSFSKFSLCPECEKEYSDPKDRRFFAQTISCEKCGPKLKLFKKKFEIKKNDNEKENETKIKQTAKFLKKGKIGLIKGWGGFHLVINATSINVKRFREQLHRGNKPFAVMAKNIESIEKFASLTQREKKLLESKKRPIVLVKKKEEIKNEKLSKSVSPNLHTVGVMLPYSALQFIIFDLIDFPLVFTSANIPGLPTIITDEEARDFFESKNCPADFLLSNNLEIINRCDDSVVKINNGKNLFLRWGRGQVPETKKLGFEFDKVKTIFAFGARHDCSISVISKGVLFQGPYIGKNDFLEVTQEMQKEFEKYISWFGKPDIVVCDLHPQFESTIFAKKISKELSVPLVQVQHHIAHSFSPLCNEGKLNKNTFSPKDDFVSIVCDGTGFGNDGNIWGGEVFLHKNGLIERAGHLAQKPFFGDETTREPIKIAASMLFEKVKGKKQKIFKEKIFKTLKKTYTENKSKFIISNLGNEKFTTTSTGRVLDGISALLGICTKSTFEGEPAMLLESVALMGDLNKKLDLNIDFENNLQISKKSEKLILETHPLLEACIDFENKNISKKNLAALIQKSLGKGIGTIACEIAEQNKIKKIVLSGGVMFNSLFLKAVEEKIGNLAQVFVCECPGDAGISAGQAIFVAKNLLNNE